MHLEGGKRSLWNLENILNLLFRWFILDLAYYKAYFAFKRIAKRNETYPKSLENITNEILEASKGIEKELF